MLWPGPGGGAPGSRAFWAGGCVALPPLWRKGLGPGAQAPLGAEDLEQGSVAGGWWGEAPSPCPRGGVCVRACRCDSCARTGCYRGFLCISTPARPQAPLCDLYRCAQVGVLGARVWLVVYTSRIRTCPHLARVAVGVGVSRLVWHPRVRTSARRGVGHVGGARVHFSVQVTQAQPPGSVATWTPGPPAGVQGLERDPHLSPHVW